MDLFDNQDWYLAHCISSDCALGAGIAVEFEKRFELKKVLLKLPMEERKHPTCILVGKVFNLITKERYFHKPTYETMALALRKMRALAEANNVARIAMPRIGSGLDKLVWEKVFLLIKTEFKDSDIQVRVCVVGDTKNKLWYNRLV